MDFNLTDEQELLVDSIKEFCERYFDEQKVKDMYAAGGVTDELVEAYLESGFGLMGIPEEQGGVPCDRVTLGLLTEEFAHYCGCLTPFLNNTLAMRDLIDFGSPEQVEMAMNAYMETGKPIFSLGFSEPGAGSDAAAAKTKAVVDGDDYIINGSKCFITNGPLSDYFAVYALTDHELGPKSMATFVVEKNTPGFTIGARHNTMGIRSAMVSELHFTDVHVPVANMISPPGEGFHTALKTLDGGRIGIASQALGIAEGAFEIARKYLMERKQFKKPLYKNQHLSFRMVDLATQIEMAKYIV